MSLCQNVHRRGGIYWWRRRFRWLETSLHIAEFRRSRSRERAASVASHLAEFARVHSTRFDEIRRYVSDGMPLPQCEAVARCQLPAS